MEKQMEKLGFTPEKDGFYSCVIGDIEIWVKNKIIIYEGREAVELCDYSYERLKKLLEVWQ